MKTYSALISNLLPFYIIGIVILICFSSYFFPIYVCVLLTTAYVVRFYSKVFGYKIQRIFINNDFIGISKANEIKSRTEEHKLSEIDFKYRTGTKQIVTYSFRNDNLGDILTVFYKEEVWFELIPDEYGWHDGTIRLLAKDLVDLNVKRLIDKFDDKDVVIN